MKVILTLTFILSSFICFGQKKDTTLTLSKLEQLKFISYDRVKDDFQKIQQEHYKFLGEYIQANNIDPNRVSIHRDSLKIVNGKLFLILKPKNK